MPKTQSHVDRQTDTLPTTYVVVKVPSGENLYMFFKKITINVEIWLDETNTTCKDIA